MLWSSTLEHVFPLRLNNIFPQMEIKGDWVSDINKSESRKRKESFPPRGLSLRSLSGKEFQMGTFDQVQTRMLWAETRKWSLM